MEKYYIAVISAVKGLGSARVRKLIKFFGSAKDVWTAEQGDIGKAGLPKDVLNAFLEFRQKNPHAVEKLIDYCAAEKIKICSIVDDDYPPILKEIKTPPAVFYYYGTLEPFANRIGMVGTRNNTEYGKKVAYEIAEELSAAEFTIVSGAARGIDSYSHKGAMKYGRTVAVLGCGIAYAFLKGNVNLIREIAENGVVMTDYKPGQVPTADTFPARNRIIAGLSRGVIVVEAGRKSGALITCGYAGDYGRDVFAVPGNIYSDKSVGCHELIRDGVILIKNAGDVLEYYNVTPSKVAVEKIVDDTKNVSDNKFIGDNKFVSDVKNVGGRKNIDDEIAKLEGVEKKVFDAIPSGDFITVDEILMAVDDVLPDEISSVLLKLELKNLIINKDDEYSRK